MPAVLVTGPTVTQNLPFSPVAVSIAIVSTHYAYPQSDSQVELAWVAALNTKRVSPQTVTHPSINRARHKANMLTEANVLRLSQTAGVLRDIGLHWSRSSLSELKCGKVGCCS